VSTKLTDGAKIKKEKETMKQQIKKIKANRKAEKGFTIIELIVVIAVLGILAVMALPTFFDLTANAKTAARDGIIGGVKGGINMFRSNALANGTAPIVPAGLDALGGGTTCSIANKCFTNVLQDPVTDGRWVKSAALTYTWSDTVGGAVLETCVYDNVAGLFTCS
jgi:prepilin-type N-terminal cleavage/methylation domain-containing protein